MADVRTHSPGRVSGYQEMSGDGYPGAGGEKLGYNPGKIHDKTFYGENEE